MSRDYESPPTFLNKYTWRDREGRWQRTRAVTLAISMRSGKQIGDFGKHVDAALAEARQQLPEDLVMARAGFGDLERLIVPGRQLVERSADDASRHLEGGTGMNEHAVLTALVEGTEDVSPDWKDALRRAGVMRRTSPRPGRP